jgi:hypothetical protein
MMANVDDRIRSALSAEDQAFLDGLDRERGLFAQIGDTFRGPIGRWTLLVYVIALLLTGLAVWIVIQMLAAPDTRSLILWSSAGWAVWLSILGIKLWSWGRMQTLTILRELKRIEVRVAQIEGR